MEEYHAKKLQDLKNSTSIIETEWSAENVLNIRKDKMFHINEKTVRKLVKIRKSLNYHSDSYNIWLVGITGITYLFRKYCRILSENYTYNAFNTLCMIANTIILTTDGSVSG